MKVCPKCNSSYTDETLNFCLTDGVPLVPQEILDEYLSKQNSKSWHTAETLVDARLPGSSARMTAINPPAPTFEMGGDATKELGVGKSNRAMMVILSFLVVIALGSTVWWFMRTDASGRGFLSENGPTPPKHAIVQLTPEQDALVKKELTEFMTVWAKTNSAKDTDAHLALYANTLEVYYGESGKDKNHVRADRLRAYQRYDTVQMSVDKVKISPESTESATVVFDKSWTMKNDKKTSTGSVEQEIHVSKTSGKWLIDSERDLRVYFINNRENSADNVNQAANAPASN